MTGRPSIFDRMQDKEPTTATKENSSLGDAFESGTSPVQENTNQVVPVNTKKEAMSIKTLSEDEISQLGNSSGNDISSFTSQLLSVQRNNEGNGMSEKLDTLISEAKNLTPEDPDSKGGIFGIFNKLMSKKESLFKRFDTVEERINILIKQLNDEKDVQISRKNDIENLIVANTQYALQLDNDFKNGEKELDKLAHKKEMLANPQTQEEASEYQKVNDLHQLLDKKVADLQALRLLSAQMDPKLNTMKSNALSLINSFDDIIGKVIPAYKMVFAQYVISNDQKRGAELQEKTTSSFNEAIKLGSDQAKENTIKIAENRNKQLINIDTLKHDHQNMIESMQKIEEIDKQGRENREAYRKDMQEMERKLIEIHQSKK